MCTLLIAGSLSTLMIQKLYKRKHEDKILPKILKINEKKSTNIFVKILSKRKV